MTRRGVRYPTILAAFLVCSPAPAQQWILDANFGGATGVEAGRGQSQQTTFRLARPRLLAGVDGRIDERPAFAYGLSAFVELAPHVSLGGELRVLRRLSDSAEGFVGVVGVVAPHTLLGGGFGVRIFMPGEAAGAAWFLEPSISALPLGTDLPGDDVLVWGLLAVGLHAPL